MKKKKKKESSSLATIGVLILLWLLFSGRLHFLLTVVEILIALGIAAALFFIIRAIVRSTDKKAATETTAGKKEPVNTHTEGEMQKARRAAEEAKAEEEAKYPPAVRAVVEEGKKAHTELEHLYATIPDLAVKKKIREIIDVSDKIISDAIEDPDDVPQIKKFLDYYLPTTIKLLNAYDRMGAQGIEGQNITGTMQSINEMLDTAIEAYKKLLDSLFANQALDIETDIEVMNTLLKREGFNSAGGATQSAGQ